LHLAVVSENREIISLLLSKDASLHRNLDGLNPFHILCQSGSIDFVKLFLSFPINIEIKDKKGKTALQHAQEGNHQEIIELLTARHAKSPSSTNSRRSSSSFPLSIENKCIIC
jgi:ankyrin repeat protein